jgi:hypothetical protein
VPRHRKETLRATRRLRTQHGACERACEGRYRPSLGRPRFAFLHVWTTDQVDPRQKKRQRFTVTLLGDRSVRCGVGRAAGCSLRKAKDERSENPYP